LKHAVALDGEDVVGCARAYRRTITWRGHTLILGGLGDVCTDPAHRRAGIATTVVQVAMQELHGAGCDLAYLCAEVQNPGIVRLYGQVGFVPLRRPHTYHGISGTLYTAVDGMIAPVRSPALFNEVLSDGEPFHIGTGNW
jgi:GNAT superfamily N-acetyltransferase